MVQEPALVLVSYWFCQQYHAAKLIWKPRDRNSGTMMKSVRVTSPQNYMGLKANRYVARTLQKHV